MRPIAKNKANLLTILLSAFLLMTAFTVCAYAETAADLKADYTGKTVILQSNDVHGAIEGYQYIAGLRDELEKRGADVLLVDSGDYMQGSIYVAESLGRSAVEIMDACGYDYVTLGNHEFDYGNIRMMANLRKLHSGIMASNLIDGKTERKVFEDNGIYADPGSDLKIGFFGQVTPETMTKSLPGNMGNVKILDGDLMYEDAAEEIDSLEARGADVIICLTHLGVDSESAPYRSYDLYEKTHAAIGTGGLSAEEIRQRYMILDGHSHDVMEQGANGEPVMSTGTKFMNIGVVVIDEKNEKIEENFLYQLRSENSESAAFLDGLYSDSSVAARAKAVKNEVDERYRQKVAESKVDLNGERGSYNKETGEITHGNRNSETNLGDLIADAFRWYATEYDTNLRADPDKTVAMINGGAIRAPLGKGDISEADILNVMPFGNTLSAMELKGSRLLEALEASTFIAPDALGAFPQVSGIEMVVDTAAAYDPQESSYPSSTYHGPASIRRVTIKSINGKPFKKNETYTVLTTDYCSTGGDTFYAFTESEKTVDTGIADRFVTSLYIKEKLGGVVGEDYAEPQGRIRMVQKKDQSLKVRAASMKSRTVRAAALKRSGAKLKALRVSGSKGKLTYARVSGARKISVDKKTGKVRIMKDLGKGTYKVKIKVTAAGNDSYRAASRTIKLSIKVK